MTHPKPFRELSRAEKGELLLAHREGKRIEFMATPGLWFRIPKGCGLLDWHIYRIATEPLIPDSINWDHVAPEWKFVTRDHDGRARLHYAKPHLNPGACRWASSSFIGAEYFASYKRGTVDWKDSLVIRPGHESSKS
jgi:hypothetical protein